MDIEIKTWIYDILASIQEIDTFIADVPDFATYQNDIKTKRAIERNLEIIGEAMNRVLKKDASIQFTNSRRIVETRNRIIHGYDTVSDEILWSIISTHIPILKQEAERYLSE
ncbi:HepT-like ribonuclease domain-containing protein [Paraflavisolibacter sp. H34]|uniref:HepT-like ribonuclease domain-containing protein n=1 Tax=Huijunlia imazamoxiresistens TaxID=3127457 RepID=UPI003018AF7C